MSAAGAKILSGAQEALGIALGEIEPARIHRPVTLNDMLTELSPNRRARVEARAGELIKKHRSKTRGRHGGASAGTERNIEASDQAASPPTAQSRA